MRFGIRYLITAAVALGGDPAWAQSQAFPPKSAEYIELDDNSLLPWAHHKAELTPITADQAKAFFAAVEAEKIESRYIVGSCEDRAHFVALMAMKAGIPVAKVWGIAPKRYTLLSQELFKVKDASGVVDYVTWGHHVAPVFLVKHGDGDIRTVVLDLAFDPKDYISLDAWTKKLGTDRGKFFFTSPLNYLFASLDGVNGSGRIISGPEGCSPNCQLHTLPTWFPNILTGDMADYSSAINDPWIASGMAQDDLAMKVFDTLTTFPAADRSTLKKAIQTENGLARLAGVASPQFEELSSATLQSLKAYYQQRKAHWTNRITTLK
jgi:Glutaminase